MAIQTESPGGGRRSLNAELNLVPFVDLLSCCICFLLMTAVWLQIGSMQVKQSYGTEAEDNKASYDLNIRFAGATDVELEFKQRGKVVQTAKINSANKEALAKEFAQTLDQTLAALPGHETIEQGKLVNGTMVTPHKDASYGNLAVVLDSLRRHQLVNIAVLPEGK